MARKEKKTAETQEDKPVAEKPAKAKREATVLHSGMIGVVVNFLVIALLAGGLFYFLTNENQRQHESVSDLYRRHHLASLDAYLRTNELVIATMTDAELLQILNMPGGDGVLTARYPGASYARIVTAALDPAVPNGISYAHQDMVLRVASGQSVSPEISFYENHQVVAFARAVRVPEGDIAGVLLLSMPFSPLAISLSGFAPEAGRLELVQRNGSERAVILKVGENLVVDQMRVVPTRNPGWEFGFAPVTSLGRNETMVSVAAGLLVLAAVLSGLLLFWLLMSLQRQIKEDAEALAVFSENLLKYGNRQRPMMHFGVFSTLMSRLDHYWTEVKANRPMSKNDAPADELGEISFREESPDLLGTAPAPKVVKPITKKGSDVGQEVRAEIFRAYDIRGVVGDGLDEVIVRAIGRAIGSEAQARGEQLVMVGRDGRLSSPT
ncbi:MAG: hypothetical protein Q8J78_17465, partial [Moraxellaceae bacterium]|nr:hypothetical protein [Moraxellaceae bacterium]